MSFAHQQQGAGTKRFLETAVWRQVVWGWKQEKTGNTTQLKRRKGER